jgi:hypothetical protein
MVKLVCHHGKNQVSVAAHTFPNGSHQLAVRPTPWNKQGYAAYAGFGWYRIPVNLPHRPMRLALFIPAVGISYQVFANGKLIGTSRGMPPSVGVISDYRRLFNIPKSAIEPGKPLVIAIRVWRSKRALPVADAGLLSAPIIGEAAQIERLRVLAIHDAFWNVTDTGLNLVFNLLTALAGLALFSLRRNEREYLWFGLAQVADRSVYVELHDQRNWVFARCTPIAEMAWARSVSVFLNRISDWPFPISAFNVAGDLAMFSVIAVLVFRYARRRRDEQRFEAELEAARAVQGVLIPEKTPTVPGYRWIASISLPARSAVISSRSFHPRAGTLWWRSEM